MKRRCRVDGCGDPFMANDLCQRHYRRWYRHGDPRLTKRRGTWRNGVGVYEVEVGGGEVVAIRIHGEADGPTIYKLALIAKAKGLT